MSKEVMEGIKKECQKLVCNSAVEFLTVVESV
jgi:hypothetical protein